MTYDSEKIKSVNLCLTRAIKTKNYSLVNYFINLGINDFKRILMDSFERDEFDLFENIIKLMIVNLYRPVKEALNIGDESLYIKLLAIIDLEKGSLKKLIDNPRYIHLLDRIHITQLAKFLDRALKGDNQNLIVNFLSKINDCNQFSEDCIEVLVKHRYLYFEILSEYMLSSNVCYQLGKQNNYNIRVNSLSDINIFYLLTGAVEAGHIDLMDTLFKTGIMTRLPIPHHFWSLLLAKTIKGKNIDLFKLILSQYQYLGYTLKEI